MALRHEIYRHDICLEGLGVNIIHWIFAFFEPAGRINERIVKSLVQVLIEHQSSILEVVLYLMSVKVLLRLKRCKGTHVGAFGKPLTALAES
jgi:hypothetical protein